MVIRIFLNIFTDDERLTRFDRNTINETIDLVKIHVCKFLFDVFVKSWTKFPEQGA